MSPTAGYLAVIRRRRGAASSWGQLALVDLLDAVAEGGLDDADVADQAVQALRLDGGGLVGAPHGAVEGDVALDEGGAEGDGGQRGLQAALVAASSRSARSGTRSAGC